MCEPEGVDKARLTEPKKEESTGSVPPSAQDLRPPDIAPPGLDPLTEIIAPSQVFLRLEGGTQTGHRVAVVAALTPEAIWIQDTWRLRQVRLQNLGIERRRKGRELALTPGPKPSAERLTLTFASATEGERCFGEIQARQQLAVDPVQGDRLPPEGVALVRRAPEVPHVVLGRVSFAGSTQGIADRGLQLRAGIRGADAIIALRRQRCSEIGWGARQVSGLAVRVEDAEGRKRFRLRWYAEEVRALVNRMLLLLVIQMALLFLVAVFSAGVSSLEVATGETRSEAVKSAGLGLALLYTWPLVLLAMVHVWRWPLLLRAAGLAVLVATTGRGLAVWLAHLLAVQTTGVTLAKSNLWTRVDPVDWALIISGMVVCVRAWRLAGDARQILPQEVQAVPPARKTWSRALLAGTGVYAIVLLGIAGISRYQTSSYLLQPGVDPRREHEALLAFNEGAAQANQGDLGSAERSFQRALGLWEALTARPSVPSVYRSNLVLTLYNLGWICDRKGHSDEAGQYYARAVALADEMAGDSLLDDQFKETVADARQALADLRAGKSSKVMDEKARAANRKYEEALVKDQKGEVEAEQLYQEAIALWEEVLPQATNEDYRKSAVAQLATANLQLGELQKQLSKRSTAESTLKKAIDYGEKAVALEPDRPLRKQNLEVARQLLDGLREQALQEEVDKLCRAERFADAVDLCLRSIEEEEEQVRSGKDHDKSVRRLAYRLDQFASFLAHCPDERVRDVKAAVKHALRATELQPEVGDYWYTLARVQYFKGDWRDSLASLEKVKAKDAALDWSGWFLSAMDLHQLKRTVEARAALRKGVEWIDEKRRQAEDNPLMRYQFEMMRPVIEAMRREAENLIEGKDPGNQKVG